MFYYDSPLAARLFDLQLVGDELLEAEHDFFMEELAGADGPALDLGCGTGRIFIPALRAGIDIFGCDRSEAFLERLVGKAARAGVNARGRVWLCDLEAPAIRPHGPIGSRFDGFALAFAAFRTFDHLVAPGTRRGFLSAVRDLLRPGGRLLLNLANPEPMALAGAVGQKILMRDDLEDAETGRRVVWWGATQYEEEGNLLHEAAQYEFLDDEGRVVDSYYFPFTMRWTPPDEMRRLAAEAGFHLEACWSEFEREPFEQGSGDSIWDFRKP